MIFNDFELMKLEYNGNTIFQIARVMDENHLKLFIFHIM